MAHTLYIVGDSTLSSFKDTYYYPRYGYGTMIDKYLNNDIVVKNIALSGRSSKSYLKEKEYTYLKENITGGDYLIIGFGHNDEKDEDPNRFTTANKDLNDPTSFPYYLYNYYIKLAKSKNATPILCTPIVRADINNNYTAKSYHITNNGNYRQAIINLGKQTDTTVIDLCLKTKELYEKIGYEKAIYFHAWPKSKKETVDTTHLNIYGAKVIAYILIDELSKTDNSLKNYIKKDIVIPNKERDLITNPNYIESPYEPFNKEKYTPTPNFKDGCRDGWFTTAFGDNGSNPLLEETGYFAKFQNNDLIIGQDGTYLKGLIGQTEGIVFTFKQIKKSENFTLSARATLIKKKVDYEAGFGIMLRDDTYTDQSIPDASILSNYVACGIYNDEINSHLIYCRENKLLQPSQYTTSYLNQGDTLDLKLERIGQVVNLSLTYKNKTYQKNYTDFDFVAIDTNYMYLGFYATKGMTVKFDNIKFNYTGKSQGA